MSYLTIQNNLISKSHTGKDLVFLTISDYNAIVDTLNGKINRGGDSMAGQLKAVGDPVDDLDMASKAWVETTANNAASGAASGVASDLAAHEQDQAAHGASSQALGGHIVARDANGQFSVGAPTLASHVARLSDVDDAANGLQAHINNANNPHPAASSSDAVANKLMLRDENGVCSVNDPQTDLDVVNLRTMTNQLNGIRNAYASINPGAPKNGDILVQGSTIYILSAGAWRQVWPAQFS